MSEFYELVGRLCPSGVEFRPLHELVDYEQPGKYLVSTKSYSDSFSTPVLTAGQSFVLGYSDEVDGVYLASPDSAVVIFDDFTTSFKWVDFPFKAKSSAMKMLTPTDRGLASLKYIYYAMQTIPYAPQDHARQWIGIYSHFRIPVPPLEVQREIVRILDRFTELEAELQAELQARRRQYAGYRDSLVAAVNGQRVAMGELGTFTRGRRFTKSDVVESGIPSLHYGEIYTDYGVSASRAIREVNENLFAQLRFAQPGAVVFAGVGETVVDVGKAVAWLGDGPVAVHDDTFSFSSSLNPKYVAYAVQTDDFHAQKANHVARGKVKRLSAAGLSKIKIPVPGADEQARIVSILDCFDALINDPEIGIPAELTARRKQYAHYRDKLLAFEEAAV